MDSFVLVALNGLALGLASTLHCAGMCGAISCSLLLAQERGGARSAQAAFALTHLGRIMAYATAGAVVGSRRRARHRLARSRGRVPAAAMGGRGVADLDRPFDRGHVAVASPFSIAALRAISGSVARAGRRIAQTRARAAHLPAWRGA